LLFDTTIPPSQCCETLAGIQNWWFAIKNVDAQNGKTMPPYILVVNHDRPIRIYVAVPDYSYTNAGVGDYCSINHFDVYTHKGKVWR